MHRYKCVSTIGSLSGALGTIDHGCETHLLSGLLLELNHLPQPADGGVALQQPRQLSMRWHVALDEDGGLGRVDTRR